MDQSIEIRDRLMRLETREEAKQESMEAMREELKALQREVSAMRSSMDAFVNQVKGGRSVLHWLWMAGGVFIASVAWLTGLVYKIVPGLPIK